MILTSTKCIQVQELKLLCRFKFIIWECVKQPARVPERHLQREFLCNIKTASLRSLLSRFQWHKSSDRICHDWWASLHLNLFLWERALAYRRGFWLLLSFKPHKSCPATWPHWVWCSWCAERLCEPFSISITWEALPDPSSNFIWSIPFLHSQSYWFGALQWAMCTPLARDGRKQYMADSLCLSDNCMCVQQCTGLNRRDQVSEQFSSYHCC